MPGIKITQEKENPLFERKEIEANITADITPSYKEIRKELSEQFSVPVTQIKLNLIEGTFGSHDFQIKANIYSSAEELEKTEKRSKKELAAEKSEAEDLQKQEEAKQAAEQPAEETSSEENQETENTEETKPEASETTNESEDAKTE